MRNVPKTEVMKRTVRSKVCPQCSQRPPGSEAWKPTVPRPCEGGCTIFINLPTLRQIAAQDNSTRGGFEVAIREMVCQTCKESLSAGDYCAQHLTRTCPLSRYANKVLDVLEHVAMETATAAGGGAAAKDAPRSGA